MHSSNSYQSPEVGLCLSMCPSEHQLIGYHRSTRSMKKPIDLSVMTASRTAFDGKNDLFRTWKLWRTRCIGVSHELVET